MKTTFLRLLFVGEFPYCLYQNYFAASRKISFDIAGTSPINTPAKFALFAVFTFGQDGATD